MSYGLKSLPRHRSCLCDRVGHQIPQLGFTKTWQSPAIDKKAGRFGDLECHEVFNIELEHRLHVSALRVQFGFLNIQARTLCLLLGQINAGLTVVGPLRLAGQQGFEHWLVFILKPGRFKHLNHLIGASVKRRVTNDQTHLLRVLPENVFDDGVEGAASFAGRVKELNDGHWR